jgi:DNA-binding transcriptional MerR regulator
MVPATAPESASSKRRKGKSASAFRTISEVAKELDLSQHVLRFWETKFQNVKPLKRGGGRRYYRPEDIVLLKQIRDLLYNDGYTIKGVQKLFRANGGKPSASPHPVSTSDSEAIHVETISEVAATPGLGGDIRVELQYILSELEDLRNLIKTS